jgi:hypothetical protein
MVPHSVVRIKVIINNKKERKYSIKEIELRQNKGILKKHGLYYEIYQKAPTVYKRQCEIERK